MESLSNLDEKIEINYSENLENDFIEKIEKKDNIEKLARKVLGAAFNKEDIPSNFLVSLDFVTKEEIKELNMQHRGIDKETDVLSFPLLNPDEIDRWTKAYKKLKEKISEEIKETKITEISNIRRRELMDEIGLDVSTIVILQDSWILGEIFINLEQIKIQSEEYNHSFTRELAYILVHSFYHLLGEDHINDDDKKHMREKEEKLLEELNILRGE